MVILTKEKNLLQVLAARGCFFVDNANTHMNMKKGIGKRLYNRPNVT